MRNPRKIHRQRFFAVAAMALSLTLFLALTTSLAQAQDGDNGGGESPFADNVVTTTTTANVNLRAQPGFSGQIIQVVPAGTVVGFTGFMDGSGDWIQVDPVGAPVGWMHRSLLASVPDGLQVRPADQPAPPAPGEEATDFPSNVVTGMTRFNVYLRSEPSQSFNIVDTLPAGTVVGYTGFMDGSGNWIEVDPAGAPVGWVWGDFLTNVPDTLQVRPADRPQQQEGMQGATPSVTVTDQALGDDGAVTVPQVTAAQDGWLVIHADNDGSPGAVIGHTAVGAGTTDDVSVDIDADMATQIVYAMLHVDAGETGTYEFPGADAPATVDGNVVVKPFMLTDLAPQEPAFAANVVTTTTTANVNLRQAPGLGSQIIQVVPEGTVVGFTGFMDETGQWLQVDPVGAPVGWMHRSLLAFVPDGLQVANLQ